MQLKIHSDYESLSKGVATEIIQTIKVKPKAILCLATGDTPRMAYALIASLAKTEKVDLSACFFVGLDEWVGIPPDNEGSCYYFLQHEVFQPLGVKSSQFHLFDGLSPDLGAECAKMNQTISEKGGIDLMLVGIGMNGHVGFNEPADVLLPLAHVIDLDEKTRSVGQKYFNRETSLKQGITLGIHQVMDAKKLILMANGLKKAEVIYKAFEEEMTPRIPAGIIRNHPNSLLMLDKAAASKLNSVN